jgi:hypothetical protein
MAAWITIAMLAMLIVPASITLHSVRSPGTLTVGDNPSPHGYTWSLLLFIVPIAAIGLWLLPGEDRKIPRRSFTVTILIVVTFGCALDFFCARYFFCFPNRQATLKILAPALGPWVPIEEYFFYLTGFVVILLLYVWFTEYWLAAYTVEDYCAESRTLSRIWKFHPESLIVGIVLIALAIAYKKWFSAVPDGLPGYFIVLVVGGIVPAVFFFPPTKRFINWRALSLTMFIILLISLLWEATLALPYGWWNYQHAEMMGVFIGAWSNLPIEAVFVWLAVTYGTVILFEAVKIVQSSERSARELFFGPRSQGTGNQRS